MIAGSECMSQWLAEIFRLLRGREKLGLASPTAACVASLGMARSSPAEDDEESPEPSRLRLLAARGRERRGGRRRRRRVGLKDRGDHFLPALLEEFNNAPKAL